MPTTNRLIAFFTFVSVMMILVIARQPALAQAATPSVEVSGSYTLGVADELRITVFNEPNLSGQFVVNSNGMLSLPLIGETRAAGATIDQLREQITTRFADGYLKNPKVTLEVLTFRPFYILGEVNKPGKYTYSSGLTVLNAVATAEGFTYRANKRRVFVKHAGAADETEVKLTPATPVQPGDTIRIGERYF